MTTLSNPERRVNHPPSPEAAFLRLCGIVRPEDAASAEGLRALSDADWARVAGFARAQGFAGLVARSLQWLRDTSGFEAPVLPGLAAIRARVVAQNLARKAQGRRISEALSRNGIPFAVLKGVVLAEEVYGDLSLRAFNDFDVLVPPESRDAAYAVALDLGYVLTRFGHVSEYARLGAHAANMAHRDGTGFDLHWALAPELAAPDQVAETWKNCVPAPRGAGLPGLRLSTEMSLVHLAAHFQSHQYVILKPLVDFHVTATIAQPPADPAAVAAIARSVRMVSVVAIAARLCEAYLSAPGQRPVIDAPAPRAARLAARFVSPAFLADAERRSRLGNWLRFLACSGSARATARAAAAAVFPGRLVLAQFFDEPFAPSLYPRYYWRQLVKVLTLSSK